MSLPHKQAPMRVWVDVDIGIAWLVRELNRIVGVRTIASCQGTIGEGGPNPYPAQVMCTWSDEAFEILNARYDITVLGDHWGYVHPKGALRASASPREKKSASAP